MRALKEIGLPRAEQTDVFTFLECRNLPRTTENLRDCTIKLFSTYRDSSQGKEEADHLPPLDSMDNAAEDLSDNQSILLKRKGARSRPGNEVLSIRKATNDANVDNAMLASANGKGLKCFMCGSTDHLLKSCTVPFTRILAYAPQKGANKGPKRINVIFEDETGGHVGEQTLVTESHQAEVPAIDSTDDSSHHVPISGNYPVELSVDEPYEESRVGQWFQPGMDTFMTDSWKGKGQEIHLAWKLPSTKSDTHDAKEVSPLIDSGASRTVCGREWPKAWTLCSVDIDTFLPPSSMKFRFGDGAAYDSDGEII